MFPYSPAQPTFVGQLDKPVNSVVLAFGKVWGVTLALAVSTSFDRSLVVFCRFLQKEQVQA